VTAALAIEGVCRRIGGREILRGLSLEIAPGSCLVLAGESGSGKTSLLRLVGGLDRADAGRIHIGAVLVEDARATFLPPERRGLGMVFQDFALWPHLSVLENVALAVPARAGGRAGRERRARDLLARLGVEACAPRLPATLSGGQQQRVGIARALAAEPRLLLLDEPFSSLDLESRESLRGELRALIVEAGLTALCVSHDPADCAQLADRVAVLEAGTISQCAAPEALFAAPASPYAARLAGWFGGVVVAAARDGADARIVLGGAPVTLPSAGARLGPARRARLFWPAGAVRADAAGAIAAECRAAQFDAGSWRGLYRVAGVTGSVATRAAERPVPGPARLDVGPDRLCLFPMEEDA